LFGGVYEKLRLLKEDTVVDAGANIGVFTIACAHKVRRVISIEPEPENYCILSEVIQVNEVKNVIAINKGLSDKSGTASIAGAGGTAHILEAEGGPVAISTLDQILEDLGENKVDVLKMDIEGFEYKALSAYKNLSSLRELILEVHSRELLEQVARLLKRSGFRPTILTAVSSKTIAANIASHPVSFLKLQALFKFQTMNQISYFIRRMDERPTSQNGRAFFIVHGQKHDAVSGVAVQGGERTRKRLTD
jgi:FkbM family methyltransferase